ncbi:MAG TPA: GlsB/YeaQ/YmgE family stress response membrane protein [Candidatus Acidoferrales bacterium]|nr:GlsB/YeaQ/YmgE family stress response membrane protein [Candidatus Acidoferrales bacterium]
MLFLISSFAFLPDAVFVGVHVNGFIAWIVIGLIAGWVAGHVTRGRGFGCIVDVVLGLIGAVIGGWIFTKLGIAVWGFWGSLAAAVVGAVVLVAIARLFAGSRN